MFPNVLVVDFDHDSRGLIAKSLAAVGYAVDAAPAAAYSARFLFERPYDLVVLNNDDPKVGGAPLARILRNLRALSQPEYIALAADPESLAKETASENLFREILPRPINLAALVNAAASALSDAPRYRARRESERLWRECGLSGRPKVKPAMRPTREEAEAIAWCFDIVESRDIDAVVTTGACKPTAAEALRADPAYALQPIIDLSGKFRSVADASFRVTDIATWAEVAETIVKSRVRRTQLAERYRTASDPDDLLLANLFVSRRPLIPTLDPRTPQCLSYSGFWPEKMVASSAARLVASGALKTSFFDRTHICSSCQSRRLNVREECLNCRSPDLKEAPIIHHYKCAYQGAETDFRVGTALICPKCRQQLRHYGSDYDKPGQIIVCGACGALNSDPAVGFSCLDCGAHADGEACSTSDVYSYALTDLAVAWMTKGDVAAHLGDAWLSLPHKVTEAAERFARDTRRTIEDVSVIEMKYRGHAQPIGGPSSALDTLRRLFVQNISDLVANDARLIEADNQDYLIVGKDGEEPIHKFASGLIASCGQTLAHGLEPSFRIVDAKSKDEAA
jgi:CheY-like chemotaxis protein